MGQTADDNNVESARTMYCSYGHEKQIARSCHTCRRIAAKHKYDTENGAGLRRDRREKHKVSGQSDARKRITTNAERIEMPGLLDNAPTNGCDHSLAYEVAEQRVMCYACGATWDLAKTEEPAAPAATKRKTRGKKTDTSVGTQEAEVSDGDDSDAVRGADVQEDAESDAESESEVDVPVPDAPTAPKDVPKTSRRGKKAKAAPSTEDEESPAYTDEGPWNGMKCPSKTCVSKLEIAYPNIYANGGATYHYGCSNCEARVTVNFPEGI